MDVILTVDDLRAALGMRGKVALVPTMGNLHEGHLSLVRIACERGDTVVASVFVNRLQFAPHEDFDTYPRTLERDYQLLAESGCDIVFAPAEKEVYPEPQAYTVHPPADLADALEGNIRPGFFTGVCTVVSKLFNMVQPAVAVFGKKDYQQLLVIRSMVRQLALPIDIVAARTIRATSGLALSSRNAYLSDSERDRAAQLYEMLRRVADAAKAGRAEWSKLESEAVSGLAQRGWQTDYVAIRRRRDLSAPTAEDQDEPLVVLGAARIGATRLIDNIEIEGPAPHATDSASATNCP